MSVFLHTQAKCSLLSLVACCVSLISESALSSHVSSLSEVTESMSRSKGCRETCVLVVGLWFTHWFECGSWCSFLRVVLQQENGREKGCWC